MNDFSDVVETLIDLINSAIPLIFAIILLVFTWKIVDAWILHADDESKVAEGKKTLVVGLVVFVVLTGLWGILAILKSSFLG